MINDSVNCLFAVCKLSIWILLRLFTGCLQSEKVVCKMNAKIYPCWDCIQHVCKVIDVVDMFYKDIISANDVYMLLIGC